MQKYTNLAAVDLGSNSFRLQVARVVEDQIYPLDSLRGMVRLAAGLTPDQYLDNAAQERALECLRGFGERLRDFPLQAVRAVGTNSLRVAKNSALFLEKAEAALGFPIEVIAGREEARLIYIGVAHGLPPSSQKRLVIDIGGGSTEFIIGKKIEPLKLESLYMGCVSYSLRFFPDGKINKSNLREAELAARMELQNIVGEFSSGQWQQAVGSSGTARSLTDILEQNGFSEQGITRDGLEKLRALILKAGDVKKLQFPGLRADRAQILPGGFAIMYAAFCALGIESMLPANGALRQGVLYDLLGRFHHNDMREVTVKQFMRLYQVDVAQAQRVEALSLEFAKQLLQGTEEDNAVSLQQMSWAARLHTIGISISHNAYHKHSAYILEHADMPGFSKKEQQRLSMLVLAHRGSLSKMQGLLRNFSDYAMVFSLRMASLFCLSRPSAELPQMRIAGNSAGFNLFFDQDWLEKNLLVSAALAEEIKAWKILGMNLQLENPGND